MDANIPPGSESDSSIRHLRERRGWSQQDLADRAGVSRQLVGAMESGRHSPSVSAALAVAGVLGVTVESLFAVPAEAAVPVFAAPPTASGPAVAARVGDRVVTVPMHRGGADVERWGFPDATATSAGVTWLPGARSDGLVVAGCDPVLGTLAELVERTAHHRIVAAHGSTGASLDALAGGRVHGVLVHGTADELPEPPVPVRRWHLARWQVGLASGRPAGPPSIEEIVMRRLSVVQRDVGAGTQRALRRALTKVGADDSVPGPVGQGHVDVARRLAQTRAPAGVTMETAALAFGLAFSPLEVHVVELWLDRRWVDLAAAQALVTTLGQPALTRHTDLLGGYDMSEAGVERINGP